MSDAIERIDAGLAHEVVAPAIVRDLNPTLIVVHGRGASATDLLPLADALGREDLLTIAPQAPYQFRGSFGLGYAWYELQEIGRPDERTFSVSLEKFLAFLDRVREGYPVDPERLVLLGFSQGAVMSLATAVREPRRASAVAALSGYLDAYSRPVAESSAVQDLPVFIGHGVQDELIAVSFGREARDTLKGLGAQVTYHEYPAPHTITQPEVGDVRTWLNATIGAPRE